MRDRVDLDERAGRKLRHLHRRAGGRPAADTARVDLVHAGEVVFASSVSKVLAEVMVNGRARSMDPPPSLTAREREVLTHIAEGLLNKQIADKLGIGVRTIETHREHIKEKLELKNTAELTQHAVQWVLENH